jgi:pyruvate formate-lyase activating enzyme-like uncharacterized protein
MKPVIPWLNESSYIEPLSPACSMCAKGAKLVLLVTGMCPVSCFYCPISFKKGGKDRIFADEWELNNEDDVEKILKEAQYIDAEGAGITGGDPLVVWQRVHTYISLLKDTFGSAFHLHLYTSGARKTEHIPDLVAAGLDEIRFHPPPSQWKTMENSPLAKGILMALQTSADVALEIPTIPGMTKDILSLIHWADSVGLNWINLNELEFSERNAERLQRRGFDVKDDISAAVKGSEETATAVLTQISGEDLAIGVHYCSSSFKDGIQLKNRITRRAHHVAQPYEVITEEGTLLKGIVESKDLTPTQLLVYLQKTYHIAPEKIHLNEEKKRVEMDVLLLDVIARKETTYHLSCYLIEEYPTADRLEVERTPLPLPDEI